jgi:hypothetical protein
LGNICPSVVLPFQTWRWTCGPDSSPVMKGSDRPSGVVMLMSTVAVTGSW